MTQTRLEHDSLGSIAIAADALWGAQTQRALHNFQFSERTLPPAFIHALLLIKQACARANADCGLLDEARANAISETCAMLLHQDTRAHFPLDVFQTGSGTSTNMNANEVIAHVASRSGDAIHPNDHVNMSQSSNDTIPSAIHLSAALALTQRLLPALEQLETQLQTRAQALADCVKTGRTHLMDAMPLTFGQELGGWAAQIRANRDRLSACLPALLTLAQGGTAIGTGINAPADFAAAVARHLRESTGLNCQPSSNFFAAISSQDTAVAVSGQLRALSVSLAKIANDLRWMNSGPLAGLSDIRLPTLQPGSSIMPGKVNPVIPEAVLMISAQVAGNDASIALAGHSGNFQLNVMLPLIAFNLLDSIALLTSACTGLETMIARFEVNSAAIEANLARNPILVTALNPIIGYEAAAAIAKEAYAQGLPVLEVARMRTDLDAAQLAALLDPRALTRGGIQS